MRVIQEQMGFKPVTIVLETQKELDTLRSIMFSVNVKPRDENMNNKVLADKIIEETDLY